MAAALSASRAVGSLSSALFQRACPCQKPAVQLAAPSCLSVRADASAEDRSVARRNVLLGGASAALALVAAGPALADFESDYAKNTTNVIEKVRYTLALDKNDPSRSVAVDELRQLSNDWVARYRREKTVAGRPSFSNIYSVLNAISGHYISFGPTYPIPKKRLDRIIEEVDIAERALGRGR